jgi:hypothetical protein
MCGERGNFSIIAAAAILLASLFALASCGSAADEAQLAGEQVNSTLLHNTVIEPGSALINPQPYAQPSQEELQASLEAELLRLGIDPEKTVAKAPSGEDNAVFSLQAIRYALDQSVGQELGVLLFWKEQNVGDYDGNGYVNISDLTALGLNFHKRPQYRGPTEAGGVSYWPLDQIDGDYLLGLKNWVFARADGDHNGEVNLADITPLALNYHTRVDGYRVYRRLPGESSFSLLPNKQDPQALFTVSRYDYAANIGKEIDDSGFTFLTDGSSVPGYAFTSHSPGPGPTEFYVAPFDLSTGTEGTPSAVISVPGNTAPQLAVTLDTEEGTSPTVLYLDFSGSSDPDGDNIGYFLRINGGQEHQFNEEQHAILLEEVGDIDIVAGVRDAFDLRSSEAFTLSLPFGGIRNADWTFTNITALSSEPDQLSPALIAGQPGIAFDDQSGEGTTLRYASAVDETGSSWTEPVQVAQASWGGFTSVKLASIAGQPAICFTDATGIIATDTYYTSSADQGVNFTVPLLIDDAVTIRADLAEFAGAPRIACATGDYRAALYTPAAEPEAAWIASSVDDLAGVYFWLESLNGRAAVLMTGEDDIHLSLQTADQQGWVSRQKMGIDYFDYFAVDSHMSVIGVAYVNSANGDLQFVSADCGMEPAALSGSLVVSEPPLRSLSVCSMSYVEGIPVLCYSVRDFSQLWMIAAIDETGSAWLPAEPIDTTGVFLSIAASLDVGGHPAVVYYDNAADVLVFARRNAPL